MQHINTGSTVKADLLSALAVDGVLHVREALPDDEPLLHSLFASGRYGEDAPLPAVLLEQQWRLRQQAYASGYPGHATLLVQAEDRTEGMLTLHDGADRLHLLELVLRPQVRGRGLGTILLRTLQALAGQRGQALSLHVLPHNRAYDLYRRLGFLDRGGDGVQRYLEWHCSEPVQSAGTLPR
ncbi:GNAT family N-acetyltransferase [Pseudomonas lopnurensis]|uniref:GNAT family N-acetyltransferase n=1 Tax=Pseudomonas lopnurensis TaxID=1477517 RepID=UPI00187A1558|nr:GNAT family N-acetyltransferase [Pseudomonas lopnurensis]MBE7373374.1 GNAT family N-acetyltransferase [Pseudomonas lopnurensis]